MTTILCTGGGGYLGTVVVRQLLAHGHPVVVLDRFDHGVQPLAGVSISRLHLIRGDIRDPHVVECAAAGCSTILHLAGIVGAPACDRDPIDADTTNVSGTQIVCEVAAVGRKRVVFASTASCYGAQRETCTEATPLSPLSRYGRNKAEAERLVVGVQGVVLRLATLFGASPRMRWDLLPHDFAWQAVHRRALEVYQPAAIRPFLHVEDAASAFVWAARSKRAVEGQIYNVGDPDSVVTKRWVAERLQVITGCTVEEGEGADVDGRNYDVSVQKILREAWGPTRHLIGALEQVVGLAQVWERR